MREHPLEHVALIVQRQVPVHGTDVDKAHVVNRITRSKTPGAAARLAGVDDADGLITLEPTQFSLDGSGDRRGEGGTSCTELEGWA